MKLEPRVQPPLTGSGVAWIGSCSGATIAVAAILVLAWPIPHRGPADSSAPVASPGPAVERTGPPHGPWGAASAVPTGTSRAPSGGSGGALPVSIGASSLATEENLPVLFTSTVNASGPFVFVWNFGDNSTSPEADPSHVYLTTGTQRVLLNVFGPNGSSGRSTLNLTVALPVVIFPPPTPPTARPGEPVDLGLATLGGVPPFRYYWQLGDRNVSHELNATHAYSRPGTYLATLWVNDSVGGQAQYSEFVLVPYPNVTATNPENGTSTTGYLWWGIGGAVVAAAAVTALWVVRSDARERSNRE